MPPRQRPAAQIDHARINPRTLHTSHRLHRISLHDFSDLQITRPHTRLSQNPLNCRHRCQPRLLRPPPQGGPADNPQSPRPQSPGPASPPL